MTERYTWGGDQRDRFDCSSFWDEDPFERGWTDRNGVRWAKAPYGIPEPQTRITFTRPKRNLIARIIRRRNNRKGRNLWHP